jgi:hypothetical protein
MNITLDQAIEIHARVLKYRLNHKAPTYARERALVFKQGWDHEGHTVVLSVAETAEKLLNGVQTGKL